jgi:uncharacterized LabA/DUF88 family protein
MPLEPKVKRASVFFDGQNLYHAVKDAFNYTFPNYDPVKLAGICVKKDWDVSSINFYTGVPDVTDNAFWHSFWTMKLDILGTKGVQVFRRSLRYNNKEYTCPSGEVISIRVGNEKGIDVRLSIDAVRMARKNEYDVCVIFSQDQDLSEVADEIKNISIEQNRWIKVASVFPASPTYSNRRGINGTEWIRIDKDFYDQCIDPIDYRPKLTPPV